MYANLVVEQNLRSTRAIVRDKDGLFGVTTVIFGGRGESTVREGDREIRSRRHKKGR